MAAQTMADSQFEAAVNANFGRLMALARAMLGAPMRDGKQPEDLVQEALLNLFRHRDGYDWSDGGWSLMAKAVARNVISCRRRKVGQSLDADAILLETLGNDADPSAEATMGETAASLRKAIESLPDDWRQALVLREQQGLAYRDIARLMQATESQVKTWLHRGRSRVAKIHTDGGG